MPRCARWTAMLVIAAWTGRASAAPGDPPPPAPQVHVTDMPGGLEWRQTFMAPRVTGNLRAVAVDPTDPKNLYVGTEEGTLAHSTDGGITWDEVELSPFLLQTPTIAPQLVGDPFKAFDVFAGFKQYLPPFVYDFDPFHRVGLPGAGAAVAGPSFAPNWVAPFRFSDTPEPLLGAVAAADPKGYQELTRIKVCPGAEYAVLVATKTRLYASPDQASFVPIFSTRESAPIEDVACSQTNPSEILVASGDGTFRSVDGGSSFDIMGGAFGTAGTTTVVLGPTEKDGKERLYAASGSDLWIGDPNDADSMHTVASPGPTSIRSIAVTPQSIWVATDDGVRVSRDAGASWDTSGDVDHFHWNMIAAIPRTTGVELVAALREELVVASDDGATFHPSFRGLSRRRIRQLAASTEGFYLVTSGEVWTTTAPRSPRPGDEATRRWAERKLRTLPTLTETMERSLARARLSDAHLAEIETKLKTRAWLPSVVLSGGYNRTAGALTNDTLVTNPTRATQSNGNGELDFIVTLNWNLPDVISSSAYNVNTLRVQLYELRKRYAFVVEDAYNERRQVLGQIADGGLDTDELLTLESRVEVLDLILEELMTGYNLRRSKEER